MKTLLTMETTHNEQQIGKFKVRVWLHSGLIKLQPKETRWKASRKQNPKIGLSRRRVQLKGGQRVTSRINIKRNKIRFDHHKGEIVDHRPVAKSIYLLGPKKKVIARIEDIEEVKLGMQTANFIELQKLIEDGKVKDVREDLCLSIVFKNNINTIDLIAPSTTVRDHWYQNLLSLIESASQYRVIKNDFNQFLLDQFRKADTDQSGTITFDEAMAMMKQLNIVFDEHEAKVIFEEANFRKAKSAHLAEALDIDEFIEFYRNISFTEVLDKEFKDVTNGCEMLDMREFKKFLLNIQKIESDEVDQTVHQLISKYEPLEANIENVAKNGHLVSSKGFRNMVLGSEFDIALKHTQKVNQDMTRPLVEYFIATSHNTYLYEDQLEGRSTTETYRIYLSQGCRSVELDIADGDEDDPEPVVFHKRTLTSKMSLSEIVETIAQYSFKYSPYPVIISLENNMKQLESQRLAAKIFRDGFGEHLITGPLFGDNENKWPSPEELREKIIIKGKRLPLDVDSNVEELEKKHNLAKELSDLVWYACSKKFISFDNVAWNYNEMTSIEETQSEKYARRQLKEYQKFTSQHLTKVYPYGLRFFSGNFDPIPHWQAGAQMVSLNYQTRTNPMLLNNALFEINGSCGYVLKPDFSPEISEKSLPKCHLIIRILCAFNLPMSDGKVIDPFVKVRLFGVRKYKRTKRITNVVSNNGLNPQWDQTFYFWNIPSAELPLTFVRFQVFDRKIFARNTLIGTQMIAFTAMAEGYRNISLYDSKNKLIDHAKLLVNIEKDWT